MSKKKAPPTLPLLPRRGTAFVIVIGVIAILLILLKFFFQSSLARHYATRFMSNEKKAEMIAEEAVELVARYLKDNVNNEWEMDRPQPGEQNLFTFFRFIGQTQWKAGGEIVPETFPSKPLIFTDITKRPLAPLGNKIEELGGVSHFPKLEVSCRFVRAQAFTAAKPDYQVPNITVKTPPPNGPTAQFLDDITLPADTAGSIKDLISKFGLDFNFPNKQQQEIYIIPPGDVPPIAKVTVTLTKLSPVKIHITINVKVNFLFINLDFNIMDKDIEIDKEFKKAVKIPDNMTVSIRSMWELAFPESTKAGADSMIWQASGLQSAIRAAWERLPQFPEPITTDALKNRRGEWYNDTEPWVIEKGGVFQITAEVHYLPSGEGGVAVDANGNQYKTGTLIRRKLIAEREFKVSDLQPVAPEYAFFAANSKLLFERKADLDAFPNGDKLGQAINWRWPEKVALATMAIHPYPGGEPMNANGLSGGGGDGGPDSTCQVPGLIRVNADQEMNLNCFIGTLEEPQLTEWAALANDKYKPNKTELPKEYQLIPTWNWYRKSPPPNPDNVPISLDYDRDHQVDFPCVRHSSIAFKPFMPPGLKNILVIFKFCDALSAPTLFYGKSHMEWPLGLAMEAPMVMNYGNIAVRVCPKGDLGGDKTEMFIYYTVRQNDYGMIGLPAYKKNSSDWVSTDYKNMPPNLYSLRQYAIKATHFYDTAADFWKDAKTSMRKGGRFIESKGLINIDGVTYIKDSLVINEPLKVFGKGMIVVKGNIEINADVTRGPLFPFDDDEEDGPPGPGPGGDGPPGGGDEPEGSTVFSLIARFGKVAVKPPCKRIEAAIYSNSTLANPSGNGLVIDGNLVCNEFDRNAINSVDVYYNSAACRITPLSVQRDAGKFEPRRYYVSLGKRWTNFEYAKY